jgi:hypothetical protein
VSIPDVYWISIDPSLPIAQHNALRQGHLTSAAWGQTADPAFRERYIAGDVDYLRFKPSETFNLMALSPFQMTVTRDYLNEYNAELARRSINPLLPSRLSAIFAFERKKDAQKAARAASRPLESVHAFELQRDELTRVAKVNMEIVSLMRYATRMGSMGSDLTDQVWGQYWTGGGEMSLDLPEPDIARRRVHTCGVTWEFLIEGRLNRLPRRH